jgi:hypothetical protein
MLHFLRRYLTERFDVPLYASLEKEKMTEICYLHT